MLVFPYTLIQAVGIFFVMLLKYIFQTMEIVQRPVISPCKYTYHCMYKFVIFKTAIVFSLSHLQNNME